MGGMKKKTRSIGSVLFLLAVTIGAVTIGAVPGFADTNVTILRSGDQGFIPTTITLDTIKQFSSTINAVDPNFKKDGNTSFTGIKLEKLLSLAGALPGDGVTLVGSDQYVGYASPKMARQALLVFELNHQPISTLKGGPLKIIYPDQAKVHGSCYTWYVDIIVAGRVQNPFLTITDKGSTKKIFLPDLDSETKTLSTNLVSVPSGCRKNFKDAVADKSVKYVTLADLLKPMLKENAATIEFIPFVGAAVRIKKPVLDYPVYIIVSHDNVPIHSALGGPFAVVFPIEKYPELTGMVPESGALFFLEKIRIE